MQVYFTRAAREDLITIWAHIAEDNPQAADRLEGAASRLADNPQIGPARDDIRPGLRSLVNGPCLLPYRIRDGRIEIVRAVHRLRDLHGLF